MKKLNNESRDMVIDYLSVEPEMNLFLLGDIETFGLNSETVSAYTDKSWCEGEIPFFILDYLGDLLIYSQQTIIDAKKIADFIKVKSIKHINGKSEIISQLIPFFTQTNVKDTILARLNLQSFTAEASNISNIRRLYVDDLEDIYNLYIQIDEFKDYYKDFSKNDAIKKIYTDLNENGRIYGAFYKEQLVSVARTTAETKDFAMIVGVSTLPNYRKNGFATRVLSVMCNDCLNEGMKFLCLFYDNPQAGNIYKQIGFQEIGIFTMLTV